MNPPKHVHVLVNPASGQEQPVLSVLHRVMKEAGARWECTVTQGADDIPRTIERLAGLSERPDAVLVSGGDGTISCAAGALAGSGLPLGILPGGTGNVVAQELGIPVEYEDAVRAHMIGPLECAELDLIDAAGTTSILRAGIGADARMMASADSDAKERLGWAAYMLAAIGQVTEDERDLYTITADGHTFECEALTVLICNIGRLGRANVRLSSDVTPFDGLLDVVVVKRGSLDAVGSVLRSLAKESATLPRSRSGTPGDPEMAVEHLPAHEVSIRCTRDVEFQIDGDPRPTVSAGETLEFRSVPASVEVLRPLLRE